MQSALHGLRRPSAKARRELLARVGLTEAADRKVGGYSGGMKRRLDLALALVHGPRMLFLDEPTTGLTSQSRAALWDEVRRLANDGVTVFLTTQYLEEADVLADRVGIIDRGKIVAEGTPAELKAEVGRPSVEALPANPPTPIAWRACSVASASPRRASPACRALPDGVGDLAEIVRALDAERAGGRRSAPALRRRSTTCSSPRPAARSRAPARGGRPGRRAAPLRPEARERDEP